ncbi:hypothetical protein SUNI508_11567 [Seiridium unicorne]|uniref:Uncharacterized protein n=1 Tax=Seiridium unicorne TaxID=138068 RepID=A0ABR2UHD2_9PEZI
MVSRPWWYHRTTHHYFGVDNGLERLAQLSHVAMEPPGNAMEFRLTAQHTVYYS